MSDLEKNVCRVHKLGVPNGPASQQKNSAQQAALRQRAPPGPAQIHNDRPGQRSGPQPKSLAKVGTQSNSDLLFRPGIRRTSARDSSPTDLVEANWERLIGDTRSVRAQGSDGADKVRRSSQPQYRGLYPTMPCAPLGQYHQVMPDGRYATFQVCQSTNSIVGSDVCHTRQTR